MFLSPTLRSWLNYCICVKTGFVQTIIRPSPIFIQAIIHNSSHIGRQNLNIAVNYLFMRFTPYISVAVILMIYYATYLCKEKVFLHMWHNYVEIARHIRITIFWQTLIAKLIVCTAKMNHLQNPQMKIPSKVLLLIFYFIAYCLFYCLFYLLLNIFIVKHVICFLLKYFARLYLN